MTSDLVERLRSINPWADMDWPEIVREAADALAAKDARISKIEAERDNARKSAAENGKEVCRQHTRAEAAESELSVLKAKLDEARSVIEPFAREADDYSREANGGFVFHDSERADDLSHLTVGHLRRARQFLGGSHDE